MVRTVMILGLQSIINYDYNNEGILIKKIESYFEGNEENLTAKYEFEFEYNNLGLIITEYQNQIINKESKKEDKRIYKYVYTFYE